MCNQWTFILFFLSFFVIVQATLERKHAYAMATIVLTSLNTLSCPRRMQREEKITVLASSCSCRNERWRHNIDILRLFNQLHSSTHLGHHFDAFHTYLCSRLLLFIVNDFYISSLIFCVIFLYYYKYRVDAVSFTLVKSCRLCNIDTCTLSDWKT